LNPSARSSREGSLDLSFEWQYFGVACAGLAGMIPFAVWVMTLGVFLVPSAMHASSGSSTFEDIAGGVAAVLLLGLPWLVPCLTLRARQPKGARITWDDHEVIEWDGPWKRAVVPWSRAETGHLQQGVGRLASHAVQIVDGSSGATITVWDDPKGAPVVRRRMCGKAKDLLAAFEQRHIVPSGAIDWSRVVDPDRPRRTWILVLGRLGYVFAVAAPIGAPDVLWPGYVIGAMGATLLAIRALPVFHELRATLRHVAASRADAGREFAFGFKLRAVRFEAFARAMFVVLVVASTIAGASVFHH
jgi:hypothetical protein